MRNRIPRIRALARTLAMLEAIVADGGRANVATLARVAGIPVSTAHRQVATLVEEGYLARIGSGRHVAGPRLLRLAHGLDEKHIVASVAAIALDRLAQRIGTVVQLGTLENDMVTYRVKTGLGAAGLFTQVGMQLEAYCSAIGKILLAHLPRPERRSYLAGGPFVALTPRTIVDRDALDAELERVAAQGFAVDDGEIAEDLYCVAVPVRGAGGSVVAAISASCARTGDRPSMQVPLGMLREAAAAVEAAVSAGD